MIRAYFVLAGTVIAAWTVVVTVVVDVVARRFEELVL